MLRERSHQTFRSTREAQTELQPPKTGETKMGCNRSPAAAPSATNRCCDDLAPVLVWSNFKKPLRYDSFLSKVCYLLCYLLAEFTAI